MTDEQIIELAKEAKLPHYWETGNIVFLDAVRHALKTVQLSGEPCEIGSVYADRLPLGTTLEGLLNEYGLTMKISKTSGRAIIEKPFRKNT